MSIDNAIANAAASVEMEGFIIDERYKEWCKKLLNGEMTMDRYIALVKRETEVESR